jgi:hypothetical protein
LDANGEAVHGKEEVEGKCIICRVGEIKKLTESGEWSEWGFGQFARVAGLSNGLIGVNFPATGFGPPISLVRSCREFLTTSAKCGSLG